MQLTPEILISAYLQGVFPMAEPHTGEVRWYAPDPRGVIPLDAFHIPRSVARTIRARRFEIRADQRFREVMQACAGPRFIEGELERETWISDELIDLYARLHFAGLAHSVEAYLDDDTLVGGLYGVALAGAFFGESMFIRPELGGTDASKVCLAALVFHLRARGYTLLDTQFINPHLGRFGGIEIARAQYLQQLDSAIKMPDVEWGDFPAACQLV
jgi:leucyl/phenylalanyl-tRNA--protein transferase